MDNTETIAVLFELRSVDYQHKLQPIITYELRTICEVVNCVIICNILGIFGIVSNIINIIIFTRQGFGSGMNISFFGLTISDTCTLLALLWFNICVNPLFENSGLSMDPSEVQHLTACSPHNCFIRVAGWIMAFITAERCLCITMPLTVKQIITPSRTKLAMCVIFTAMITAYVPEFATVYIDWKFYPAKNKTLLGLAFRSNRKSVEGLVFIMYTVLGLLSFLAVFIFTVCLILKLRSKTKWRQEFTFNNAQSENLSNRDKRAINMVVLIATVTIICYVPGTVISIVTYIVPEFSITGSYVNIFMATWSFAFVFEASNSSVNIFLYYKMSSKYRRSFNQLFAGCMKRASSDLSEQSMEDATCGRASEKNISR